MVRLHYFEEQVRDHLIQDGFFLFLRMFEFTYFHTFISLIGLTFRTYTLYSRKVIKNRTFKSLIHKGSELILGMEGKVVKGYESSKRCAVDSGSATVKKYEEILFGP